ncbi:MAG: hypothetical protein AAB270_01480, partial [Chloroflexota bacterium]
VAIALKDGRELQTKVLHSKGTQENPATPKELQDKFTLLAEQTLPKPRVHKILQTIINLESVADVRQLGDLLLV